ncbi:carotenoid 9,10(9',10')-cleavage dioxygenase 1 isoform X2 [Brachypodium distachyon]|uniref:Uncharacterized protein n=1 Tax=Brachypodium distachyon TaxID=15368 RepID=A0A2K2D159_BRADI|nr:carotenoid 9,10(9',10')-cleavage dioxygenase 1 isoform X2 [Brachypodium distachyon]PNT68008.1 hypothetical protein BRADI_3g34727v3 [Brachypodium distachyon]|eukprot:XP_014756289.1 carotenoid 9,10(9',10')-cleavage dioxygenase 1 isoform X2 [Brachypodium distachyon]
MVVAAYMPVSSLGQRMSFPRIRPWPANTRPAATSSPMASPYFKELQQQITSKLAEASERLLDAFVDSTFTFSNQSLRPTESNFAPVDEIGELTTILDIEGDIPADFPEGVYIRNGSNPQFGALHNVDSVFGRSENIWVEGEGMVHAVYFSKSSMGTWSVQYANRYVQSDTFKFGKRRQRPFALPAATGEPTAMLAGYALNMLRFGKPFQNYSNTSVFEHSGRVYTIAENNVPQEIDLQNLDTVGRHDFGGDWNTPCTSHPKVVPGSGELVICGFNLTKPFLMVGVVSADGKNLTHKVDLKLDRCTFCHEIGVTTLYNIIMDTPLTVNPRRMLRGAPLIDYDKESYARIGVMPRYGDANSVLWFDVEPFCTFHLVNCHEEDDEVIVRGIRVPPSVLVGLNQAHLTSANDQGTDEEYFSRLYEWRLNLKTGAVKGKYITGKDVALEFPVINDQFAGLHHSYAYAQVVHSTASLAGGSGTVRPKFGGFAKLYLEEAVSKYSELAEKEDLINVEYHHLNANQFCSGATFVPNVNGGHEDHGWIISFVHDEDTNISQAHIINTRRFESEAIAKITLPQRVPYGFHGTFISKNK